MEQLKVDDLDRYWSSREPPLLYISTLEERSMYHCLSRWKGLPFAYFDQPA